MQILIQQQVWDEAQEFAFLTTSQVTLTLLVQGPHLEWQGQCIAHSFHLS